MRFLIQVAFLFIKICLLTHLIDLHKNCFSANDSCAVSI